MNPKKGSIFFRWMESINSQVYVAGFSGNINVHIDVIKNLFCEVSSEIMKIVAEKDFNRAERLFQLLHHYVFSFHMCNITRNREMKLPNKTFLLLVSCLVDLHIFLCRKDPDSDHLKNCMRDILLFIGTDASSLLDVLLHCKLLKKKHSAIVVPIMKRAMQKVPTAISSPEEYMKLMLLMRQWKMFCDLKKDKYDILNIAGKVRPPDNLFSWLARLHLETPANLSFSSTKKLFARHFIHKKCPKGFCKKLQEALRRSDLDAADIHSSTDEYMSNYAWNNNQTSLISTDAQQLVLDQDNTEHGGFLIDCSGLKKHQEQQFEAPECSSFEGENAGKKSKKRLKNRSGNKEDYDASENCADETLPEIGIKRKKKSTSRDHDSDIHSSSEDDLDRSTGHPDDSGLFFIDDKVCAHEHDLESVDTLYERRGFDDILGNHQNFEGESAKKKSGKRLKERALSENLVSMSPVKMGCDVERYHKSSSNLLNSAKDNANESFPEGHSMDPYSFGDTEVEASQINVKREDNANLIESSVVCSAQPLQLGHSSEKLKGKKLKKNIPCESEIQFHVTKTVDENLVKNKMPDPNVDFCSENLKAHGSTKKRKRNKSLVVEEVVLLDYGNSADKTTVGLNEASEVTSSNNCSFTPDRKLKKMKKKLNKSSNLSFKLEDSCKMSQSAVGEEDGSYSADVDKESCVSNKKKHRKKNNMSGNYERVEVGGMSVNLHKEGNIDHSEDSYKMSQSEIGEEDGSYSVDVDKESCIASSKKKKHRHRRKKNLSGNYQRVEDADMSVNLHREGNIDHSDKTEAEEIKIEDVLHSEIHLELPNEKEESQIHKRKRGSTPDTSDLWDVSTSEKATESLVEIRKRDSSESCQKNKTWEGDSAVNDEIVLPGKKKKRRLKGKNFSMCEDHDSVDADNSSLANDKIALENSFECSGEWLSANSSFNSSYSESNLEKPKRRKKVGKCELVSYEFDSTPQNKSIYNDAMEGASENTSKDWQSRVSISGMESSFDNSLSHSNWGKSNKKKQKHELVETTVKLDREEVENYGNNFLSESRSVDALSLDIGVGEEKVINCRNDSLSPVICISDESFSTVEKNDIPINDISGNSNSSSILSVVDEENTIPSSSKRRSYEGIKALERETPLITEVGTGNDSVDPIIEKGNSNSSSMDSENTIPSSSTRRSFEGTKALERETPLITEAYTGNDSLGGNDLKIEETTEIHKETKCDDLSFGGCETYCSESSAVFDVQFSPRAAHQANYHETSSSIKPFNMQKEHDDLCNSLVSASPVSLTSSTSVVLSPNKRTPMSRSSPSKKESFASENNLNSVTSCNLSGNHGQVNDSKNGSVELTGSLALPFQSPRKVTDNKPSGNFAKTCPNYEKLSDIWLPFQSEEKLFTDSDDLEIIPSSQIKSSECVMNDSKVVSVKSNEMDGSAPDKDVNSCLAALDSSSEESSCFHSEGESSSLEIKCEIPEKLKTTPKGAGSFIGKHENKSKSGESFVKEKSENVSGESFVKEKSENVSGESFLKEKSENVSGESLSGIPDSEWNEAIGITNPEDPTVSTNESFSGTSDVDGGLDTEHRPSNSCEKQNVSGDSGDLDRSKQILIPVVWLSPLKDHHLKSVNLPQESDHKSATPPKDASPKLSLVIELPNCEDSHSVNSSSLDQSNRNPESSVKENVNDNGGSDSPNRSSDNHAGNEETRKRRSSEKSVQHIEEQANNVVDDVSKNSKKSSLSPTCSSEMEKSVQQNILCAKGESDKAEEILKFSSVEIPFLPTQDTPKYKPCEENVFSRIAKRNSDLKVPPVLISALQKQESDMSPLRQSSRIRQKLEEKQSSASGINNPLGISPFLRSKILQKDLDVTAVRHSPRIVQKPISFFFGAKQPSPAKAKDSTSSVFLSNSIVDSKKYLDFSDLKISPQKNVPESKNVSLRLKLKEDETASASPTKVSDHKSRATPSKSSPKKCAESPFSSWKSRLRKSGMKKSSFQRSASRNSVSSSATKLTNDDESSVEPDPEGSTKKHEARGKPKEQSTKKQLAFDSNTSVTDQSLNELCLKFSSCSRSPADGRQRKRFPSEASLRSSSEDSETESIKKPHNNMTPCRRIISDSETSSSEKLPSLEDFVNRCKKSPSKASSHSSSEDSVIKSTRKSVDKTSRRIVSDSDSSSSSDVKVSAKRVPSKRLNAPAGKSASTSKPRLLNTPDIPDEAKDGYNLRPRRSIILPSKLKV